MSMSPHSIMVVDDEVELANLFREFLTKLGFKATSFTNPLIAFEHYESNYAKYSIVITDLRMPGMSGIDLARKIRQMNIHTKIILITAFDVADLKDNPVYNQAKIDSVIQKPIKFSRVAKIIGNALRVQSKQNPATLH